MARKRQEVPEIWELERAPSHREMEQLTGGERYEWLHGSERSGAVLRFQGYPQADHHAPALQIRRLNGDRQAVVGVRVDYRPRRMKVGMLYEHIGTVWWAISSQEKEKWTTHEFQLALVSIPETPAVRIVRTYRAPCE